MEQNPVEITKDDAGQYKVEHARHFFDTVTHEIILSMSQENKEKFFSMVTDHQKLLQKLFGDAGEKSVANLPTSAIENEVDSLLIQQYQKWLNK